MAISPFHFAFGKESAGIFLTGEEVIDRKDERRRGGNGRNRCTIGHVVHNRKERPDGT
jgi:hypothetical protein